MTDHFRSIDITGVQPVALTQQPAPQLMWVDLANLVIDDQYQRPLNTGNWKAIRRIAGDFRWSRFSPVIVAPIAGGRYALIDGQHRAHAAALCGIESIPAMVALVAPEEQALAFIEINTRQIRVGGHAIYRAALTAGEDWAIRCKAAVEAAGCTLMTRNNVSKDDKKPGQVFAIALIRKMIEAGKDDAVTAGLSALMAYDESATANFADVLLTPWLNAAAETDATVEQLVGALHVRRPWLVIEVADRLAKDEGKPKATVRRDFFITSIRAGSEVAA